MTDTPLSRDEILSRFADNVTGQISENDLRDFVVSSLGEVGGLIVSDGTTAQTGINGTFQKLTAFTSAQATDGLTADAGADEITVNREGIYGVYVQLSFKDGSKNIYDVAVGKNGTAQPIKFQRKLGSTGDIGSASCFGLIPLEVGDVLSVMIKSDGTNDSNGSNGSNDSITVVHGQFLAERKT